MVRFRDAYARVLGIGDSTPAISFVILTACLVALLQFPATYVMHYVSLGLGIGINEFIIIAGVPILITFLCKFDRRVLFPFTSPVHKSGIPLFMLVLGVVIVMDYLTAGSEAILPLPEKHRITLDSVMAVSSIADYVYKFILLCIVPGLCEEIFFRGYCQTSLALRRGNVFAIVVTGLMFALLHGNPWHMHLYFILGCFLSWVYAVSGTLWVPIAVHVFNNALTFTNHTLGTTFPSSNVSLPVNVGVLIFGIVIAIMGGIHFVRTSKTR